MIQMSDEIDEDVIVIKDETTRSILKILQRQQREIRDLRLMIEENENTIRALTDFNNLEWPYVEK